MADDKHDNDEESECGQPCAPSEACEECAEYWDRMREAGYWDDHKGWTTLGMRHVCRG